MVDQQIREAVILKEIAELLNEGSEMRETLSAVLERLLQVTRLKTGWLFLIKNNEPTLIAYHHLPQALTRNQLAPMCTKECWCVNRYNNGELNRASNIINCKRIEDAKKDGHADIEGLTHHATVPLRFGEEMFGILNVGAPNKIHFSEKELSLLESVAFQIGSTLKRMALTEREREMALIEERNRLAQELHDSVNQLLFSVSLTARGGRELTKSKTVQETFTYIQELSQQALHEMRDLIWQLQPKSLENGLLSSLKEYSEMLGLQLYCHVNTLTNISGQKETLWRIAQEAMMNCKKHSGQDKIEIAIDFNQEKQKVQMIITDQGVGFNYSPSVILPSHGLRNMRQRAERQNGTMEIFTSEGNGTKIIIDLFN